jgi:hypothetical protein
MTHEHAKQQFTQAIRVLVDDASAIKERLIVAFTTQLERLNPQADLPESLVSRFADLKTRLICYDRQGDKGNVTSQVRAMSDSEAGEVADEIFDMFLELHGIQARETQENS